MKCCDYNAGMLRQQLVIQSLTKVSDDEGGWTEVWSDVATLPAKVEPVSGGEYWQGMKLEAHLTHRATVRYYAGLDATMRAKLGTRLFNIRSVMDIEERHRWHVLMMEEGVRV